jgi:GIY-YIG catalytic domain
LTFASGEQRLSEWLEENARVAWLPCEAPWTVEAQLISTLHLPLKLEQNSRCSFHCVLSQLRRDAKRRARELPILTA